MELQLSPKRQAQLNEYARRYGQEPGAGLDEIVAEALDWERLDREEAVEGIRREYSDFKAGRVRSLAESFTQVREKHGLPR